MKRFQHPANLVSLGLLGVFALSYAAGAFAEDEHQFMTREARQQWQLQHDKGHLHGKFDNLERREAHLAREDQRDLAKHHGHLTPDERRHLQHEQNQLDHRIHEDNH